MAGDSPVPLGADSLMWDIAGELRAMFMIPSTLLLQVMHPMVGAAVQEHSVFRSDPWGRASRTSNAMLRYIYGGELAVEEGLRLRRMHRDFHGVDSAGRSYHALNGAAYAWVNATLFERYLTACALFGRGLSAQQQRRLYAESVQLGRLLRVPDREMPATLAEFHVYFANMLSTELECNDATRQLLADIRRPPAPPMLATVSALWRVPSAPLGTAAHFITAGTLPPRARELLGLRWNAVDQRRFDRFVAGVRRTVPLLPRRLRYVPAVLRIKMRAAQTEGVNGPPAW
ncbi:MAG TPA: oxygenase MpaB family protein [Pseudonocardiaceae bacterium]